MNPKRIPKNRYSGSSHTIGNHESRKEQPTSDKPKENDPLKELEMQIDAGAVHIGMAIADIFTFLTKSSAMLPNMELETELIHLKVDDGGIFVEITRPEQRTCTDCPYDNEPDEDNADCDYDDDEEGLLYDGD